MIEQMEEQLADNENACYDKETEEEEEEEEDENENYDNDD